MNLFGKMAAALAGVAFCLMHSAASAATTVNWVNWTNPGSYPNTNTNVEPYSYTNGAVGTLTLPDNTSVNVTLTGEVLVYSCFAATISGCPAGWWRNTAQGWGPNVEYPSGTFTSTNVPTVPTNANLITQAGYVPAVAKHTLTFSQPVTNIVMNVVSLGGMAGVSAYKFDQDFTVLSQNTKCTGSLNNVSPITNCLTVSGRTLSGREGSGSLQFTGTYTSISWEVTVPEVYSGFNIGVTSASFAAQAPLLLSATALNVAPSGTSTLSTSGGSGSGAVTYALVSGPCSLSGNVLTGNSNGSCVVTATKAGDGTYASLSSSPLTIVVSSTPPIEQDALTLNANPLSIVQGGSSTLSTSGGSGTGAVTYTLISGPCSVSGNMLFGTGVGSCSVTATKAGDGTYASLTTSAVTISVTSSTLVPQAPLTLSAGAGSIELGTSTMLSTSGGSGTGAVTYTLVSGPCALNGNVLSGGNVGSCVVTATKASDGTYASSTTDPVTVVITAAPVAAVCGSAHNAGASPLLSTPPSANLCSAGSAGPVASGQQSYTWQCQGANGGADASCQAPRGYVVTPSAGVNGGLSPSTPQTVAYNATLNFTATPNAGYLIGSISGCGGTATGAGVNAYATGSVTESCTVEASFTKRTADTGQSPTGTGPVTLGLDGGGEQCALANIAYEQASAAGGTPPEGYRFLHGVVRFSTNATCTPNGSVTITITYPSTVPAAAKFFKYGPATPGAAPTWYEHPATISGNTVTYSVTDNGQGDSNPAEGTIADPAGVAVFASSGAQAIPTLGGWALLLLGSLLGGLGLHRVGRQRA